MEYNNVYIGSRYVPLFDGPWDNTKSYEPLTIVLYGNNSYTSKRPVPVGTLPTDSAYWALTGNYNGEMSYLQQQINTNAANIQALKNRYNESSLSIFKNKSICIMGDSISDETTYNPNWVDAFTEVVTTVGATVTNASITGSSLVGWAADPTIIPQDHDIYIVALGVNDFQGQFKLDDLRNAISAIATRIGLNDSSRRGYYVSPIKMFRTQASLGNPTTPLGAYRGTCEALFNETGFSIISGDNVPNLSLFTETTYLADKLHPASVFRYIFAYHIIDTIISGVSEHSFFKGFTKAISPIEGVASGGNVTIKWTSHCTFDLVFNLTDVTVAANSWKSICNLTGLAKAMDYTIGINMDSSNLQVQCSNGVVQVAFPSSGTINISGVAHCVFTVDTSIS